MNEVDVCGICGNETPDEKPLYDQSGDETGFKVACCDEHNVRIVGSSNPDEDVEPYVDENGQPRVGYHFQIVWLD